LHKVKASHCITGEKTLNAVAADDDDDHDDGSSGCKEDKGCEDYGTIHTLPLVVVLGRSVHWLGKSGG